MTKPNKTLSGKENKKTKILKRQSRVMSPDNEIKMALYVTERYSELKDFEKTFASYDTKIGEFHNGLGLTYTKEEYHKIFRLTWIISNYELDKEHMKKRGHISEEKKNDSSYFPSLSFVEQLLENFSHTALFNFISCKKIIIMNRRKRKYEYLNLKLGQNLGHDYKRGEVVSSTTFQINHDRRIFWLYPQHVNE